MEFGLIQHKLCILVNKYKKEVFINIFYIYLIIAFLPVCNIWTNYNKFRYKKLTQRKIHCSTMISYSEMSKESKNIWFKDVLPKKFFRLFLPIYVNFF